MSNVDSFKTKKSLRIKGKSHEYFSLAAFSSWGIGDLAQMPYSHRILLENLLRHEDGVQVTRDDIVALAERDPADSNPYEIQFMPARVLLQDFTGVPAVVDLAAVRSALLSLGGDPSLVNPGIPVDLVIDHSIQVDRFGTAFAFKRNEEAEFDRNRERYELLKWAQTAFDNFTVVPPNTGICHQVNLEFLGKVAMISTKNGGSYVYPDTLVGTDSHTPMINGLGILGWGVGGIEAEAVLLGQPYSMVIPQVVGVRLTGKLSSGATATDLVLFVTQILRKKGVVGKFVEYFGPGVPGLTIADRATLGNMTPEYGATVGIFPVDEKTVGYLNLTGRTEEANLVEEYFKAQGLWYDPSSQESSYTEVVDVDLSAIEASLAGPKRPQDRLALGEVKESFFKLLETEGKIGDDLHDRHHLECWLDEGGCLPEEEMFSSIGEVPRDVCVPVHESDGSTYYLCHGCVVISAITSCTNTSNPSVMVAAGLLARNAVKRGLKPKPWVKTSLAPGSKTVTEYLIDAGLMPYLEALGYHVVGYGCTTCIGNSGPLPGPVREAVMNEDLVVASVLSGNRNFEGRIHNQVRANYLASPPLVVAYGIAGKITLDLSQDPLGYDTSGEEVYLKDIWPDRSEVEELISKFVTPSKFQESYSNVHKGSEGWNMMKISTGKNFSWSDTSTYIKAPPYFDGVTSDVGVIQDIFGARVLALLGDSVTTDHISPAGAIPEKSPAGKYLISEGVKPSDFNSYGSRRGNHEVMVRGTFANLRVRNQLVPGIEGGVTLLFPEGEQIWIYDAAKKYAARGVPLIVIAGREYGTGSSRDWAAKGVRLMGVRAVIAGSFERIHRSNLIGMGVLPLEFLEGDSWESLGLTGKETFDIKGLSSLSPMDSVEVTASLEGGKKMSFFTRARIDTPHEMEYFEHGGILPYVLRQILKQ